ncbi:RGS domain-containing GTPase-activating protein [Helicobacter sp. 11S03491-1]|uniref:RGS domain-containing GTPase-activating protein n=1 Tax=Helicobacter sp. 11S03491-1 TaxID=1476196 RepID=UPI000BA69B11|nr:RGS domain-containing GTPase-activating protein [Helicobacter sp. 11S03491-1]PAF42176.1 hypothetical protein BKH45_04305 [Helicobacter sp. 11S03491-1]
MKKLIFWIILTLSLVNPAQALIVLTTKALDFNKKSGEFKAHVVLGNKIQKAQAIGNYKVSSNKKSVIFNVISIFKDNQTHTLSSQPTLIKPIKNKILKKGSKLILAGENQEEIAKIFGLSLEDYQKKSGTKATNAKGSSSNSGSTSTNSNASSSGNANSTSSGSSNGVGGFGNNSFKDSGGNNWGSNYIPNTSSNSNPNGTNYYPVPSGSNNDSSGSSTPEYSTQFCKAPFYDSKNSISLSFIAKDGSCVDVKAQRDDTKCAYRYDFNAGVAIKQTQFYYVDNENQTKNVGGCVDLEGDEYSFPLYKDDSKCQLQVTKDKGYGGNQAYFFQTQILFRGDDGLVHVAKDCTDYQNVQEELISYDKDSVAKEVKRVVNQYYVDPISGKKVYINNGIISPFKFKYREYSCGAWEFDDAHLQAYRRTQIKAFDNVANEYIDITSCDYSNDEGKSGKITMPYIKLPNNEKPGASEPGDMNGTYTFELKKRIINSSNQHILYPCADFWSSWNRSSDFKYYTNGNLKTLTQWKSTYKTTNTGVTTGYQRPKQEDEKEPSIYYVSKRIKDIERTTVLLQNDLNLSADYMKFYEVNENYYKDESIKKTPEYTDFISKYYKPKAGSLCLLYGFSGQNAGGEKNCETIWANNTSYYCIQHNNYLTP